MSEVTGPQPTKKRCPRCKETLESAAFRDRKGLRTGQLAAYCNPCHLIYQQGRDLQKAYYVAIKSRAKKRGIPFNLDRSDLVVPTHCPVLGIPLLSNRRYLTGVLGPTDNSPSVDRIVPQRGYTKGNVIVVSMKANRIKNDASLEELQQVLDFYRKREEEKSR